MAAATASRVGSNIIKTEPRGFDIAVGLETGDALFPAYTLVGVKATGYAEEAVSTVPYNLIGVIEQEYDTSGDTSDGDSTGDVRVGCVVKLVGSGLTAANVGSPVWLTDNQTVSTTQGEGKKVTTIIAGGAAGAHTVTGIQAEDQLDRVLHETTAGLIVDLTSEFSVTADNTIDNTGGTDTSSDSLIVEYTVKTPAFVGYITEVISATSCYVFIPGPGRLAPGTIA